MAANTKKVTVVLSDTSSPVNDSKNNVSTDKGESISERTSGLISKKRIRTSTNGVSIMNFIKTKTGDAAYSSTYNKIMRSVTAPSGSEAYNAAAEYASSRADLAKSNAQFATLIALDTAKKTIDAGLDMVGTFQSNQAVTNRVDNVRSAVSGVANFASGIIAGAALGGPVGAAIAAVGQVATTALQMGKRAIENNKDNFKDNIETTRTRERLGYVATGYNR